MDRDHAVSIVNAVKLIGADLDLLDSLTERIQDSEERREFRTCLGRIIAAMNTDILIPIFVEFPELDPDS